MTSLLYKFPRLYKLLLRIIYGKVMQKRYEVIAKLIGKNKKVLDLGCGFCELSNYLDKSCTYEGWDLNERFLKKSNNLNVKKKNVFDFKDYPKTDVIVIMDLLHHVVPRHKELITNSRKKAKKVIISEPHVSIKTNNKFKRLITKFFDSILGDDDGINSFNQRSLWYGTKKEVHDFFKSLDPKFIKEVGPDYLVVI